MKTPERHTTGKRGATHGTVGGHGRHTAVGTLQMFAGSILSLPTGIITAAFLTRKLGPESYGVFTVTVAIVLWIEIAVASGFSRTAAKFVAQERDWEGVASKLVRILLIVCMGAAAVLCLCAPWLCALINSPELIPLVRLLSLEIPARGMFNMLQSVLAGRGKFSQQALLNALYWPCRLALILLIVGLSPSVRGALLANIGASFTVLVLAWTLVRPALTRRSDFPVGMVWRYAWPLFLFSVSLLLFNNLGLIAVKALSPIKEAAGFFGAATNLSIVPVLFASAFSPLLLSKMSYLSSEGETAAARNLAFQSIRVVVGLLPFAAMTAGLADEVAVAIYGSPFLQTGGLLALLIFAALGGAMIRVATSTLTAAGRPGLGAMVTLPLTLTALICHLWAVPRFGATGAAAVTAALAWAGAAAAVLLARELWKCPLPLATLAKSIFVCVTAYALAALWPAPGLWLLIKIPAVSALILGVYIALGEFTASDLALFRSIFSGRNISNTESQA
jgi:O-antigen/teichoic acid export membrane protein